MKIVVSNNLLRMHPSQVEENLSSQRLIFKEDNDKNKLYSQSDIEVSSSEATNEKNMFLSQIPKVTQSVDICKDDDNYVEIVRSTNNGDSRSPSRLSDDEGSCGRISPGGPSDEYPPTETILPLQPIPQRFPYNISHSPTSEKPINYTSSSTLMPRLKTESEKSFASVCHSSTASPSSSPTASPGSPSRSCSPYISSPPLTPPVSYSSFQDCPTARGLPFSSSSSLYPGGMLASGGIISSGTSAFLPHPRRAMAVAAAAAVAFSPAAAAAAALSPATSHLLSVATSSNNNNSNNCSVSSVSSSFSGSSSSPYGSARLTPARIASGRSGEQGQKFLHTI